MRSNRVKENEDSRVLDHSISKRKEKKQVTNQRNFLEDQTEKRRRLANIICKTMIKKQTL